MCFLLSTTLLRSLFRTLTFSLRTFSSLSVVIYTAFSATAAGNPCTRTSICSTVFIRLDYCHNVSVNCVRMTFRVRLDGQVDRVNGFLRVFENYSKCKNKQIELTSEKTPNLWVASLFYIFSLCFRTKVTLRSRTWTHCVQQLRILSYDLTRILNWIYCSVNPLKPDLMSNSKANYNLFEIYFINQWKSKKIIIMRIPQRILAK